MLEKRYSSTRTNFSRLFSFLRRDSCCVIILHFRKLTVTRVLGVATYPREVTIHPGVNTRVARPRASFAPRYNSCELDTPQIVDLSIERSLDEI